MHSFSGRAAAAIIGAIGAASVCVDCARAQVGTCERPEAEAYLDVGNVRTRIFNNGAYVWRGDPWVYEVPKGNGISSIFASTFMIGGYVDGELRVAAARYGSYEFWPGPLDEAGNPPADCSDYDRIWNVYRSDIQRYEAGGPPTSDLADWPTGLGAPTIAPASDDGIDNDEDGVVDEPDEVRRVHDELLELPLSQRADRVIDLESGERPQMIGDQMLWWIMNDAGNRHNHSGSNPIGLEVHGTAFAFEGAGPQRDATFYRKRLSMRGDQGLDSAFVALFVDPDLGNFQDDYSGADTSLGLGFVYNGDEFDDRTDWTPGYGETPPALGYDFLHGPLVPSPGDTARTFDAVVPEHRNLGLTSFIFWPYSGWAEPDYPVAIYRLMHGLRWLDGSAITEWGDGYQEGGAPTPFMYPGDPVTRSFWSELNTDGSGARNATADRRWLASTGPFRIEPRRHQEVLWGVVWARGAGHLDSVTELRRADEQLQAFADNGFELPRPPDPPVLDLTALDEAVVLEWRNPEESINFREKYREHHPLAHPAHPWAEFEGYEVLSFADDRDSTGSVIVTYDHVNGVTRVEDDLDGDGFLDRPTHGSDSGIRHAHLVDGLTNYRTYYFGVRAYAYARDAPRQIMYSDVARASVVPAPPSAVVTDAAVEASMDDSIPDFVATQIAGSGLGAVSADVVNPVAMRDATYRISFYDLVGNVTYDVARDDSTVFDGSSAGVPALQRTNVFVADGLEFSVVPDSAGGLQAGDVFEFSTAGYGATEPDLETQRARLDEIGIVPNPYKAFSDYEVDLANDEVRFTGLPDVATIRVFTLHGTIVRTLRKDSPGLRSLSWDVRNEDGRKLASGMYLIHVEVPGVGERVIKFGMVKDGVVETSF